MCLRRMRKRLKIILKISDLFKYKSFLTSNHFADVTHRLRTGSARPKAIYNIDVYTVGGHVDALGDGCVNRREGRRWDNLKCRRVTRFCFSSRFRLSFISSRRVTRLRFVRSHFVGHVCFRRTPSDEVIICQGTTIHPIPIQLVIRVV